MAEEIKLTLEKFEDLGGKYFEQIVAIALDELGYVEGATYLGAWAQKCVPGTWVEADFIISRKNDKLNDPLNNGRIVLAIGHATSEDSARMKFHRDVEQLLEVKALPNGEEYRVIDILFCCPRETMGGWNKELVEINEAIFDNSLIIWKHDWGRRLLQQIQLHGEKLTQGENSAKRRKLESLLSKHSAFRRQFEAFRDHLSAMLHEKKSHSKIADIFHGERQQLPIRLAIPLIITESGETDFKRGLIQVLALNPWEVKLLHVNHEKNRNGKVVPLEKLALDLGMSQNEFDRWWRRLKLLSVKFGTCSTDFCGDEILNPDAREWRTFSAGSEFSFVLNHFPMDALFGFSKNIISSSENLSAYTLELRDLSRIDQVLVFIGDALLNDDYSRFYEGMCEHFESGEFLGLERKRLVLLEVAMAVVCSHAPKFSYDKLAKKSGDPNLVSNSNQFRRYPKLQGNPRQAIFQAGCRSLWSALRELPAGWIEKQKPLVLETFISRSLYGMVRQPRAGEGALDVLLKETIISFADRVDASVKIAKDYGGEVSAFCAFVGSSAAGVNVEVPYILTLKSGSRILIHRVSASDGNAGHKWKEFSSKIRSIRYEFCEKENFRAINSIHSTVLIIDGNWTRHAVDDPFALIRALQVAGWDYVVYPDQIASALDQIEAKLGGLRKGAKTAVPTRQKIVLGSIEDLPLAAENTNLPKLKRKGGNE